MMASRTNLSLLQRLLGVRPYGFLGVGRSSRARKREGLIGYDQAFILGHTASTDSWQIKVVREEQPEEHIPISKSTLPVIVNVFDVLTKPSEMTEINPNLIAEFAAALERAEAARARLRSAIEHADRLEYRAQHAIKTSQELIERAHS
jgi:hypothetical protein